MERTLYKELTKWKLEKERFPILLRGARQVGKTYLIEQFGREEFESLAMVNFEAQPEAIACFESLDPVSILSRLETVLGQSILPGRTLLFLDEIQACPKAIAALRYFKEKRPDLHVIGAGSLLEFALAQGKFSFPVGRVQFLYLKPLSFLEYALARGASLAELDKSSLQRTPSQEAHENFSKLVAEYFLIGGMPAVVSSFCKDSSWLMSTRIQDLLLATYRADFAKYSVDSQQKYLKTLFEGIPELLGQQFKYAKIDPHFRSRELKEALQLLEWAGLVLPIYATAAAGIPLGAQIKRNAFKLLFLDLGLAQRALQIEPEEVFSQDISLINKGQLAEQFVGQELLAYMEPHRESQLFYWQREKSGSDAEVDYVWTHSRKIIPIEVKSGRYGKLKSLHQFIQEKNSPFGVRISSLPLSFEQGVLSIPFYLIAHLNRFIDEALNQ